MNRVDILIIAEGTYPYVRGGVSSWIDQLIRGLGEYNFGILFLGSKREDYKEKKYEFPKNLIYFKEKYLFDLEAKNPKKREGDKKEFEKIENFYKALKSGKDVEIKDYFTKDFADKIPLEDFMYSKSSWEFIERRYFENQKDLSFLDYFWSIRSIHKPLWLLFSLAKEIDFPKTVHSPSTGYAGFLASLISSFHNIPFILTEHGIYIRERKMDIYAADALDTRRYTLQKTSISEDYLKKMWINFFERIGLLTYKNAKYILSLFQGAKNIQIKLGAKRDKCQVIPNGVDIKRLKPLVKKRKKEALKVITLLGRVVPIKDIKTFIRAMKLTVKEFPSAEGWIVGPTDEDPNYFKECEMMVESMGLKESVKFLGFQKIDEILPQSGILTLTSISEGMPLVILEGFAAGLPCVATDVGSCRDLIYGALNREDKQIGKAGEVVGVTDFAGLSKAYIKILKNENLWREYQKNALLRVEKFYTQDLFFENYRKIYNEALKWRQ